MRSKFEKRYVFLLCLVVLLISCRAFLKVKYGFNKPFNFTTKESYISFLQKKNIDVTKMIFPDNNSRIPFLMSIIRDSLTVYYGCLINDSVELVKTKELKDNLSCMGRVLDDIRIKAPGLSKSDSSLFIKSQFKTYQFNFLYNSKRLDLNQTNQKLKIIMLYSYASGSYFDDTFDEVRKFHENHKESTELYIITIDDVSKLQ